MAGNVNPGGILPYSRHADRQIRPPTRLPAAWAPLDQRGHRASSIPAPSAIEIEMRRAPVLDQRRAAVPARAAVDLLDIGPALATGGDHVALLPRLLGHEPDEVLGAVDAAERAAQLGEGPGAAAEMTGQPPPAVLDDVGEPGWTAAERTDAERPPPSGRCSRTRRVQRLEGGSQPERWPARRHDVGGKPARLFDGAGADAAAHGQERGGPTRPASQASASAAAPARARRWPGPLRPSLRPSGLPRPRRRPTPARPPPAGRPAPSASRHASALQGTTRDRGADHAPT